VIRVQFVVVTVTECGTECVQRMLQEDMHEGAGMNSLILKAIWHMLRKKQQIDKFSSKGFLCEGDQRLKGVCFVRSV